MKPSCKLLKPFILASTLLMALASAGAAAKQEPLRNSLQIEQAGPAARFTLRYPGNWATRQGDDRYSIELIRMEPEVPGMEAGPAARLLIWTERRSSHDAALERLREIASAFDTPGEYLEIGGWPAYQRIHTAPMERIGQEDREAGRKPLIDHVTFAIAAGPDVIRIEGRAFARQSPAVQEIQEMGRNLVFAAPGDTVRTQLELDGLRSEPRIEPDRPPIGGPDEATIGGSASNPFDFNRAESSQTGLVRNLANFSEIEVVVSPDGRDIIVATNGRRYSTSNDGGVTFTQDEINTPGIAGTDDVAYNANGDPSLAFGQSGTFYFAFIAFPDGSGGAGNGTAGCTNAITASTTGLTFTHRGHATLCPLNDPDPGGPGTTCFPDQEHIAADRWNPSASGMDQVYSAWRNFTPSSGDPKCDSLGSGFVQAKIVCSNDSGQTFGSTRNINGDFPRVTVGQDGFVYVVTQVGNSIEIDKFSSCQSGLVRQTDFPSTVATGVTAVTCPVPGLDRCNDGNDLRSATAAVDDEDAGHVFVAWAQNTSSSNENVYIKDSTNGGKNWGSAVQLNSGFSARRYMPWVCSVGGKAYSGWYDRRSAGAVDNSLTDYYGGSAERTGSGLMSGGEFRISPTADSNCGSGWPCAPRSTNDSESCSQQPQLAGVCRDNDPDTTDSEIRCDFSDGGCPTGATSPSGNDESCKGGGGCPKYGDYNGVACAAGRIYMSYASATGPGGPQTQEIDSYLQQQLVCCVPQIQVPGPLAFGAVCIGESATKTMDVCNTGMENLEVASVTSNSPMFTVAAPSSGYPVVISPDFCFPFQVSFTPTSTGAKTAKLTIVGNDPVNPSVMVDATGNGTEENISTTVADAGNFGDVCIGEFKDLNLTISNTGGCSLTVTNIVSSSPEFITPGTVFPLVIAPGVSTAVPLRFQPAGLGAKSANFTVSSSDPDTPSRVVPVSGNVPPGDIRVTGSTDFGDVCAEQQAEKTVHVCNTGHCNLNVAGASVDCADFTLINNPFPATVSPDSCLDLVVRFTPTSAGPKTCHLTITSDDPDTPAKVLDLTANTPLASIDVPPALAFAPVVVQEVDACSSALPWPVSNTGQCNLRINAFGVSTNPEEYSLTGLPSFPIILEPGHIAGEGDLRAVFKPLSLDRNRLGALSVTYVSDPILGTTMTASRDMCGEGVFTGARVLVTRGGVPVSTVEQIRLQRINANRNKDRVDAGDTSKDLALVTVTPTAPCLPFQYHKEYGTVSNPIQLLPGSYQVTVRVRIDGRVQSKTVAFDVTSCGFNPNIVVNF